MKTLNPNIDLETFFSQLHATYHKVLLLDYDGTLAPFHVNPGEAIPYPGVREVLDKIMQAPGTRLVIITGRWIKDFVPLLRLQNQPEIWGSHGLERLKADGSYEIGPIEEEVLPGLVAADEWVESVGLSDRCEEKPGCLAFHWRGMGEASIREMRERILREWSLFAERWGLKLIEFDGGVELRVPGRNKGDAVSTILGETGKVAAAAYLGDDRTDEHAFKSIKGRGLGVLVREAFRPTYADVWIKPPEELLAFLARWLPT
jgi:trehalose-phosphatase